MDSKTKYLQFPLFLLRDVFINKHDAFEKIIKYGIYHYSKKFHYSIDDVARQLVYDLYKDELSSNIVKQINSLQSDIIGCNEDYKGFDIKGQFAPDDEIEELKRAFLQYPKLKEDAIEHYQMHLSYKSLGITGSIEQTLRVAKEIKQQMPEHEPMPMVNKDLLFRFRDNEKSEFELAQFLCYIAVKSILGTKVSAKTNKQHIVSRMFGYSSIKHVPSKMNKQITELFKKYSTRYHIDKLIQALELETWNVITYSHNMRGMYIAMANKITIDELALTGERKKQKFKIAELKNKKCEATKKALQQLNKGQPLK